MNDQERITDFLCSEKKMSANYDTFSSEAVNVKVKDAFMGLFNQSHQAQTQRAPIRGHAEEECHSDRERQQQRHYGQIPDAAVTMDGINVRKLLFHGLSLLNPARR